MPREAPLGDIHIKTCSECGGGVRIIASCVSESHVRGSHRQEQSWRVYDKRYWPGDMATDHISFTLRHENIDLLVLKRAFEAIDENALVDFIKSAPTGVETRRTWFFYETLIGKQLALEDAGMVRAVDALDPKTYFTGKGRLSRRHRVRDNLLGEGGFVPVLRRTEKLEEFLSRNLAEKAAETIGRRGAHLIARAASFCFWLIAARVLRSRENARRMAVLNDGAVPCSKRGRTK